MLRTSPPLPWLPASLALFSSLCGPVAADPLTPAEQALILDTHNQFRADIANGSVSGQPGAANMARLVWDPALAATAQGWADGCTFGHNPHRLADYQAHGGSAGSVGENIYARSNDVEVPLRGTTAWFDEHVDYHGETIPNGNFNAYGHYTQLAWANTRALGCAQASCPGLFAGAGDQFLVCNYAPAGNFSGQVPYETGPAASHCPGDLPLADGGLCTAAAVAAAEPARVPALPDLAALALGLALAGLAQRRLR